MNTSAKVSARRLAPYAGAVALHATVAWLGLARAPTTATDAPRALANVSDVELDLAEREPALHVDDSPARITPSAHEPTRNGAAGVPLGGVRSPSPSAELPEGSEPSPITREPRAYALDPAAADTSAASPQVDLGIKPGSWARWSGFAGSAPGNAHAGAPPPRPASSTGGLAEALETTDCQAGLGPSGAVLAAAHDAASGGSPESGVAQFAVTVYRDGSVDVALLASSNDAAAWSSVGTAMTTRLRRRPPRISSGRRGVRIVVEIAAEERRASGGSARGEPSHAMITPPSLQSSELAKAEIAKRSPGSAPPHSPTSARWT